MKILDGRGILLAIADDVKICAPPSVIAEIVDRLPALAMSEAGLTTQASKNRIYVQPSARAAWTAYLDANPRREDVNTLSLHDIPDGRLPTPNEFDDAFYEPHQGPSWPEADGINILGTPLGSPAFVTQYLQGKLEKHKLLLSFIEDVAKVGFSREAHKMLIGYAVPRLTHIMKSVSKDDSSIEWMKTVDDVHLSTWLSCVGAATLDLSLQGTQRDHLSASLDLPPQFGGVGL